MAIIAHAENMDRYRAGEGQVREGGFSTLFKALLPRPGVVAGGFKGMNRAFSARCGEQGGSDEALIRSVFARFHPATFVTASTMVLFSQSSF